MRRTIALSSLALVLALVRPSAATPPFPPIGGAPSAIDCATRTFTLTLASPGAPDPDGTAARPYGSINAALASLVKRNACGVNLLLGRGDYPESITTTLRNVSIQGSPAGARPVVRGTIDHRGGGTLALNGIDIVAAARIGIREVGGTVTLSAVRVGDTSLVKTEIDTGIGLWATDAEVVMRLSVFERNAHNAIRVEGGRAWIIASVLRSSGLHPLVRARATSTPNAPNIDIGALLVTRGAMAWVSGVTIEDSIGAGVDVAERARARLEKVTVRRTTGDGAQGIAVHNDAIVEASESGSIGSAGAGLGVVSASLTMNNGFVTGSPVGAYLSNPRMSTRCLQRGTQYRDVGIPLQADHYDLPTLDATTTPPCPTFDARPPPS